MKKYRNPSAIKPIYPTDPNVIIVQIETVPFYEDADPETPPSRAYAVTMRTMDTCITDELRHATIRSAKARLDTFTDLLPSAQTIQPAV